MNEDTIYADVDLYPGWGEPMDDVSFLAAIDPTRHKGGGVFLRIRGSSRGPTLEISLSPDAARRLALAMVGEAETSGQPSGEPDG